MSLREASLDLRALKLSLILLGLSLRQGSYRLCYSYTRVESEARELKAVTPE